MKNGYERNKRVLQLQYQGKVPRTIDEIYVEKSQLKVFGLQLYSCKAGAG